MKRLLCGVPFALLILYPLLVYVGLLHAGPRAVGVLIAAVLSARILTVRRSGMSLPFFVPLGAGLLLVLWMDVVRGSGLGALLVPAFISFSLCAVFAVTLRRPPSVVERIVSSLGYSPAPEERLYSRSVTMVWAAVLAANGFIAFGTAVAASREVWALYTGFLSYVLMGGLFAAETLYRYWRFRRYIGAPGERCLKRLFPPR